MQIIPTLKTTTATTRNHVQAVQSRAQVCRLTETIPHMFHSSNEPKCGFNGELQGLASNRKRSPRAAPRRGAAPGLSSPRTTLGPLRGPRPFPRAICTLLSPPLVFFAIWNWEDQRLELPSNVHVAHEHLMSSCWHRPCTGLSSDGHSPALHCAA